MRKFFFGRKKIFNKCNKLENLSVNTKTRGNSHEVLNFPILQIKILDVFITIEKKQRSY